MFHSDDRGDHWALVESLWNQEAKKWMGGGYDYPGIHSVLVHPSAPSRVIARVSCGGVWVSEDSGNRWANHADGMRAAYVPPELANDPDVQDPHIVVQNATDPNVMWATHHNGLFHTTDGAQSWHEIPSAGPSIFGFAAASHPLDPKTAWFVPAVSDETRVPVDGRFVVTRTRNGGKTFEVLNEGLPQDKAYDLVYRHGLDVDETGDRLVTGSTTGSLWTSKDGGDHWQNFSAHLPPIYTVRFAGSS